MQRFRPMLCAVVVGMWAAWSGAAALGQPEPPPEVVHFPMDGGTHFVYKGLADLPIGGLEVRAGLENLKPIEVIVITADGEVIEAMTTVLFAGELEQFTTATGMFMAVRTPDLGGAPGSVLLSVPPLPGEIRLRTVNIGVCQSNKRDALRLHAPQRLHLTVHNTGECRLSVKVLSTNDEGDRKQVMWEFVRPGASITIDLEMKQVNGRDTLTTVELQCLDSTVDLACNCTIQGYLSPVAGGAMKRGSVVSGATVDDECPSGRVPVFLSDKRGVFVIEVHNPATRPDGTATCPFEMKFQALRFESKSNWDIRLTREVIEPGGSAQVLFDNRKFGGVVSVDITCSDPGDGCLASVSANVEETPEETVFSTSTVSQSDCDAGAGVYFYTNLLPSVMGFKVSVEMGACPVEMTVTRGRVESPAEGAQFPAGQSREVRVAHPPANPAWMIQPGGQIGDTYAVMFRCTPGPPGSTCNFSVTPVH